jgi:16S rRNA (cytidine1402-2'-O)-methyltransferase
MDKDAPHTLIYYESPYRLDGFLKDALEVFGDREAALANDLTKMFEKVERAPLSSLLALASKKKLKGEYIVVIAGDDKEIKGRDRKEILEDEEIEDGEEEEDAEEENEEEE